MLPSLLMFLAPVATLLVWWPTVRRIIAPWPAVPVVSAAARRAGLAPSAPPPDAHAPPARRGA